MHGEGTEEAAGERFSSVAVLIGIIRMEASVVGSRSIELLPQASRHPGIIRSQPLSFDSSFFPYYCLRRPRNYTKSPDCFLFKPNPPLSLSLPIDLPVLFCQQPPDTSPADPMRWPRLPRSGHQSTE